MKSIFPKNEILKENNTFTNVLSELYKIKILSSKSISKISNDDIQKIISSSGIKIDPENTEQIKIIITKMLTFFCYFMEFPDTITGLISKNNPFSKLQKLMIEYNTIIQQFIQYSKRIKKFKGIPNKSPKNNQTPKINSSHSEKQNKSNSLYSSFTKSFTKSVSQISTYAMSTLKKTTETFQKYRGVSQSYFFKKNVLYALKLIVFFRIIRRRMLIEINNIKKIKINNEEIMGKLSDIEKIMNTLKIGDVYVSQFSEKINNKILSKNIYALSNNGYQKNIKEILSTYKEKYKQL